MNRRRFFGLLGAIAVAPKVLAQLPAAEPEYEMVRVPVDILRGGKFGSLDGMNGDFGYGYGPVIDYHWEKRLKVRQ